MFSTTSLISNAMASDLNETPTEDAAAALRAFALSLPILPREKLQSVFSMVATLVAKSSLGVPKPLSTSKDVAQNMSENKELYSGNTKSMRAASLFLREVRSSTRYERYLESCCIAWIVSSPKAEGSKVLKRMSSAI